jgi:hypothetical protein
MQGDGRTETLYEILHEIPPELLDVEKSDGKIVEFRYDLDDKKWVYMRFREDKDTPNHRSTVISVWETIINGVELDAVMIYTHIQFIWN